MTETSPISFQSETSTVDVRVKIVGRIQPHCEVKIVEDDGSTCAVGQTGELDKRLSVRKGIGTGCRGKIPNLLSKSGWMKIR